MIRPQLVVRIDLDERTGCRHSSEKTPHPSGKLDDTTTSCIFTRNVLKYQRTTPTESPVEHSRPVRALQVFRQDWYCIEPGPAYPASEQRQLPCNARKDSPQGTGYVYLAPPRDLRSPGSPLRVGSGTVGLIPRAPGRGSSGTPHCSSSSWAYPSFVSLSFERINQPQAFPLPGTTSSSIFSIAYQVLSQVTSPSPLATLNTGPSARVAPRPPNIPALPQLPATTNQSMGGLSQPVCGKLLSQAALVSSSQVEAVLAAYCYAKWINCGGNPSTASRKLHLLTLYLRAVHLLQKHYEAFTIIAFTLKHHPSSLLDYSLTRTCASSQSDLSSSELNQTNSNSSPSQEAWSLALKRPKSMFRRMYPVPLDGGGGGGGYLLTVTGNGSRSRSGNGGANSDGQISGGANEAEGELVMNGAQRPGFGRSISEGSMSGLSALGETAQDGEQGMGRGAGFAGADEGSNEDSLEQMRERLRLRAGRGTSQGLGRGLLSAPPMYDASVLADYIERNRHMMPTHRAPGWDEEELPGWTPRLAAAQ
ncbi:BQ5605_C003g02194 [Microbotryum silenes-dioicae]|uniref:BQ5605_C003g02194 protein n=1 Tax=Microbotryum silenes-dioicae TaxID=796604 RepID=A0A2X0M4I3_9BASI|nr:BQ5605_C003g02194 [Microbotryum silenes-dioicae]